MQILLADAKSMKVKQGLCSSSVPCFLEEATSFACDMLAYDIPTYRDMFSCSENIARQTKSFFLNFGQECSSPAILAYHGQAYKHLKAESFTSEDLIFANRHLVILSFLYGFLRPLNAVSSYRMEGDLYLPSAGGLNLFGFWKPKLTDLLIDTVNSDDGVLLHLATEEYQHLFDWKKVCENVRVIQPLFYVQTDKGLKMQAVWAKTCRGAMTRYVIQNRVEKVEDLYDFSYEGFFL